MPRIHRITKRRNAAACDLPADLKWDTVETGGYTLEQLQAWQDVHAGTEATDPMTEMEVDWMIRKLRGEEL